MPKRIRKNFGWIAAWAVTALASHWLFPKGVDTGWLFLVGGFGFAAGTAVETERQSKDEQRREEAQRAKWLELCAPIRDERESLLRKIHKRFATSCRR
jgi:hypothetical protein